MTLTDFYDDKYKYEICVDEVGRGCMFGDAVVSCVVLPKPCTFPRENIKDSKKFSSKKKLFAEAENIKQHVSYHHSASISPQVIDQKNILQAVMDGMHQCIDAALRHIQSVDPDVSYREVLAVIDGNYFRQFVFQGNFLPAVTVKQGDAKYVGIAAASILAKTTRDNAIYRLCEERPYLDTQYNIAKNVGYGTKAHLAGIAQFGITKYHRRSFGVCRSAPLTGDVEESVPEESS